MVINMKKIIAALVIGAAVGSLATHMYTPELTQGEKGLAIIKAMHKQGGPQAMAENFIPKMYDVRPSDIHLVYDFSKTPTTATATVTPPGGDSECKVTLDQVPSEVYPEYGWRIFSMGCKPKNAV
jgi:hypothetical protein